MNNTIIITTLIILFIIYLDTTGRLSSIKSYLK